MRPQKSLLMIGLAAITGLSLLVIGCSGDSSSSNITPGLLTDPEFGAVQNHVNNMIDSTVSYITGGLENLYVTPGDTDVVIVAYGPTPGDSVSADYAYENGWHIVSWSGRFADKTAFFRDSIQFRDRLGQPQQTQDSTETLIYKRQWAESAVDTSISHTNYAASVSLILDDLVSGYANISGTHNLDVSITTVTVDSTTRRDISVDGTISNLFVVETPVGWYQNCPRSGTIGTAASMSYQKDAGTPVASDWSFSVTFSSGLASVVAVSGTTQWTYSEQICITEG
jgi:hypothetical protein